MSDKPTVDIKSNGRRSENMFPEVRNNQRSPFLLFIQCTTRNEVLESGKRKSYSDWKGRGQITPVCQKYKLLHRKFLRHNQRLLKS